jgi:hypothetical protein
VWYRSSIDTHGVASGTTRRHLLAVLNKTLDAATAALPLLWDMARRIRGVQRSDLAEGAKTAIRNRGACAAGNGQPPTAYGMAAVADDAIER